MTSSRHILTVIPQRRSTHLTSERSSIPRTIIHICKASGFYLYYRACEVVVSTLWRSCCAKHFLWFSVNVSALRSIGLSPKVHGRLIHTSTYKISFYIISFHIISYHIISYHIQTHHAHFPENSFFLLIATVANTILYRMIGNKQSLFQSLCVSSLPTCVSGASYQEIAQSVKVLNRHGI